LISMKMLQILKQNGENAKMLVETGRKFSSSCR